MDRNALIEATARKTGGDAAQVSAQHVEQVLDALFGTVDRPGTIAEGLRNGETVSIMGFGDFHLEGARPALRPGRALNEYVDGTVG
ncbi:DNA-binding protein [Streptomyces sp. NPDC005899]|uniref:HU family DNA-binding protein n=1 Tax=Streptomyces sp. NPDC005899 TaxID=3155716 RepID=UPI0033D4B40A